MLNYLYHIQTEVIMAQSKEWNWNAADRSRWLTPSQECIYYAYKWQQEGLQTLLDLGCGIGRHTLYFAQHGFHVTAADLSQDAVNAAAALCREHEVPSESVAFEAADMLALPFAPESFDCVFSYQVISHQDTAGVQRAIDEITRVLKPGGKVFLTLCSKEHYAFHNPQFPKLDENTILRTEGAETDVPHFFADKPLIRRLFHDYDLLSVRHVTACVMDALEESGKPVREKSHYFIEAARQ